MRGGVTPRLKNWLTFSFEPMFPEKQRTLRIFSGGRFKFSPGRWIFC